MNNKKKEPPKSEKKEPPKCVNKESPKYAKKEPPKCNKKEPPESDKKKPPESDKKKPPESDKKKPPEHPGTSRRRPTDLKFKDMDSKLYASPSYQFQSSVIESFVGKNAVETSRRRMSTYDKQEFAKNVAENFAKLGKKPTEQQLRGVIANLSLHLKSKKKLAVDALDFSSEEFRNQVLESFVGLDETFSPQDLERIFESLGLLAEEGSEGDETPTTSSSVKSKKK